MLTKSLLAALPLSLWAVAHAETMMEPFDIFMSSDSTVQYARGDKVDNNAICQTMGDGEYTFSLLLEQQLDDDRDMCANSTVAIMDNDCVIQDILKYPDEVTNSQLVPQDYPYTIFEDFLQGAIVIDVGQFCELADDSDPHVQFGYMGSQYKASNSDYCNSIVDSDHELWACGKAFNVEGDD
ncbi:hypothetical protein P170DRAFT_132919 [Aspergillus steynii IBT 23096]|uniref:Ecp2 effector protein domain-containing protein n=1 Tax=Aspergillus steynii IBT 23096 TaxID=1392250 RepID=A0A2I2GAG5_9EURO|nr:uncharacterized protein P170DRAFT_132919 [Aspergillus steynii IBT 23096]PLB49871.1 hypothetical protein P170DRAFT_132919 [Aspergillus steynii IBT 23096]